MLALVIIIAEHAELRSASLRGDACHAYVRSMSPLLDDQDALGRGEAYQRCMQELGKPYPDHQRAQLYATLSVEETLRDVAAQLVELTK